MAIIIIKIERQGMPGKMYKLIKNISQFSAFHSLCVEGIASACRGGRRYFEVSLVSRPLRKCYFNDLDASGSSKKYQSESTFQIESAQKSDTFRPTESYLGITDTGRIQTINPQG